jgi:hypothetical protein
MVTNAAEMTDGCFIDPASVPENSYSLLSQAEGSGFQGFNDVLN